MNEVYELISLFTVSFLAETILPAQSEVVLAGLQIAEKSSALLTIVAVL